MTQDRIERLGNSLVHHGKQSDRVYLMRLDPGDMPGLTVRLEDMARSCGYSKIFVKIPKPFVQIFTEHGYRQEARVPDFYNGKEDAFFLGKYLVPERAINHHAEKIADILRLAMSARKNQKKDICNLHDLNIRKAVTDDAKAIASVYEDVFETYPFPIYDPGYIIETMKSHINYYIAYSGEVITGISSAEIDWSAENAEMTDFATIPKYRKQGIAQKLLFFMEMDISKERIKTVYTIARALSYGINITFARCGYDFAGLLINNTNIAGSVESMNVWYKRLNQSCR
jgi:beta-lysine N6-acetyltransferase